MEEKLQRQILDMLSSIDNIEDFLKVEYINGKIDQQVTQELLRLLRETTEIGLN
jgi:hypothetical protein